MRYRASKSQAAHLLHLNAIKKGLELDYSITGDLIHNYFYNGQISAAKSLFKFLFRDNTQILNYRIKELLVSGLDLQVIDLYHLLHLSNGTPDNYTYPYVLNACANLSAIEEGEFLHTHTLKSGFECNQYVGNSLIDMYSKCGFLKAARCVFDKMPRRNLVSWNSIISGYGFNGCFIAALDLCVLMRTEGLRLDKVGMKIVLPICGELRELKLGESVHAHIITSGWSSCTVVVTAVIDMYIKCGKLRVAEELFHALPCKDVVSWNAMLSGYSWVGDPQKVLKVFRIMQAQALKPNFVSVIVSLQACADVSVSVSGEVIHGYMTKLGLDQDFSVETLLMDMYFKCGKLLSACRVLNEVSRGNVNLWSSVIQGLGMHGLGQAALMVFFQLLKKRMEPDEVCFLVSLSSCSHNGLVEEGEELFNYMIKQFSIEPGMEHYVAMVDLYGRAGFIEEALEFIHEMPIEPDISVWGAFLGACRIHGKFQMGEPLRERLVELGPKTTGYYKMLLSLFGAQGNWYEVNDIRRLMEEKGLERNSGCSLIATSS